jgi:ribosomal protein L11 methyltransferase
MSIFEFSVQTDAEGAEALAAAFNDYAYGGAVIEEAVTPDADQVIDTARPFTVRAFLLPGEELEPKRRALEEMVWHYSLLRPVSEPRLRELTEEDWANGWKKYYTTQRIGNHVVINPSWLEFVPEKDDVVVALDPGMAFGTGLHPSTRLCVRALEKLMWVDARVLDVGTGSGILSIVAAKMGARHVKALDIDPVAVESARDNARLNHVEAIVQASEGSASAQPGNEFDIVVANILAEVIVELAPVLVLNLAPAGVLVTSGILLEKTETVRESLRQLGLYSEIEIEEDWVALTSRKNQTLT